MNKSLLSELLDGAAFPAMMLAAAVSQINVSPEQGDAPRQDKGVSEERSAPLFIHVQLLDSPRQQKSEAGHHERTTTQTDTFQALGPWPVG
jgi:hypothetical protein